MGGNPAKLREVYTGQRVSGVPFRAFSRKATTRSGGALEVY